MKLNKKIIVIGCGHGGLRAAMLLAEANADVTVYEKSAIENLSHDRTDCIEMKLFEDFDINPGDGSYKGSPCSFLAPFSDEALYIWSDEAKRDMTVERGNFVRGLIQDAENSGVKFVFGTAVEDLIVSDLTVCGVIVNGEKIYCDLVIDASGMMSPFRGRVPSICGLTASPNDDEVFSTYHASYNFADDVPVPQGKNIWKLYLKFMGKLGISWVNCERENDAAILIGMIGKLSNEDFEELFAELKRQNPIISDTLIRGGDFAPISVRYPASIFVSSGYACIGDSAFMTIPLLGSGIANAIRAGQMLGEEIINAKSCDVNALWNYQRRYYKEIGAVSCIIDALKRGLLAEPDSELKYLFESGIIKDEDVMFIFGGPSVKYDIADILNRMKKLLHAYSAVGIMAKYIAKGILAAEICMLIPKKYDLVSVTRWAKRLDRCFGKK